MKKFVMSWKALIVIVFTIMLVTFFQFAAQKAIQSITNSWEGTPIFIGWDEKDKNIAMKLLCDRKETSTTNVKLIMSQLTSPDKPLPTIYLFEDGSVRIK